MLPTKLQAGLADFDSAFETSYEDRANQTRGSFLNAFPLDALSRMTLDEYVIGRRQPTFYDYLEHTAEDVVIGQKLRALRLDRGLSQSELAGRVGVTFQQLQKYESGVNRISAGRLARIAAALDVPVTAFYDAADAERGDHSFAYLRSAGAVRLARAYSTIAERGPKAALVASCRSAGAGAIDANFAQLKLKASRSRQCWSRLAATRHRQCRCRRCRRFRSAAIPADAARCRRCRPNGCPAIFHRSTWLVAGLNQRMSSVPSPVKSALPTML